MKLKKSGVDYFNTKTIKFLSTSLVKPLDYIIHLCTKNSTWLEVLTTAEIKHIFPSGNKGSPSNYRPTSPISTLTKIFEKLNIRGS